MSGFIQLGASEISIGERDGNVAIPVTRTGDTSRPVTIQYRLDSDTATAGQDFDAPTGVILTATIPAGASSLLLPVPILDDSQAEATEAFIISLVNVDSGTVLSPRTARVSILDDENPVTPPANPPLISDYQVQLTPVISGLSEPIDLDFSPLDPSIGYVATKGGQIYAYDFDTGARLSTVLDISAKVNSFQDRGLLGVALHPDLDDNPYLYAFYVVDPADTAGKTGNAGPDGGGNRFSYLSRFTLDESNGDLTVVPGSEVVLLGGAGRTLADLSGGGAIDSTSSLSTPSSEIDPATGGYKQDFLKMDSRSHAGGGLAFGPDGMLYVSVGDGTSYNFADPRTISVQSVDSLSGKILRIDPLTGSGLADNPFYEAGDSLAENSSKVYQLGLRNAFRISFDDHGRLMMSDTGWNTWEELNSGPPGANFGWPYFEGGDAGVSIRTVQYPQVLPNSAAFYAAVANGSIEITAPFRAFNHAASAPGYQANAIVGGMAYLEGGNYPAGLQDYYLFTDFNDGEIYAVDVNNRQHIAYLTTAASGFGPAMFANGADGYAYTVDLIPGTISRLLVTEKGGTTGDVVFRWAAGAADVAAINSGPTWLADPSIVKGGPTQIYVGGITGFHGSVASTTPLALFNSERWDPATGAEMQLDFGSGLDAGTYAVRLFMANAYDGTKAVGSRVFDVFIENQLAFNDVDLVARFGDKKGGMLTWTGQVLDGRIDIDFGHVVENPLVNGVEILRVGPAIPQVTLSVNPTAGSEAAATDVTLTVTASAAVSGAQTVALSLSGAGVTAGDFVGPIPSTITIPNGATSASITLKVADDALIEALETATFAISNPSSGLVLGATTTASVTITDNDTPPPLPQVSLSVTPASGSEAAGTDITLTVTASAAVSGAQTVALALSGAGVTAGDFVGTIPSTITIPNGATSASISFKVADDALVEALETATFAISNPSSGVILGATTTASVTITDNDAPPPLPQVSLSVTPGTGSEAAGTDITLTLTASAAVSGPQTVALALTGTGVTAGDFVGTIPATLTIPNGATSTSITLKVADDALVEGTETARFTISNPSSGVVLGAATSGQVTITDNDTAPGGDVLFRWAAGGTTIAATDGGIAWSGGTSLVTGGPTQVYAGGITELHASVPTTTPTALFASERWDPPTGAEMGLDFGSGLAAGAYTVRLFMGNGYAGTSAVGNRVFDILVENQLAFDDVDLVARFGHMKGGMLEWTGQVTDGRIDVDFRHVVENPLVNGVEILRAGPALPQVSLNVSPTSGSESAGTDVTVTVTASAPVSGPQTVALALSGSGVTAGDFVGAIPSTLTIADGATSASFTVKVADDALVEGLETARFTLSNPSSGLALGSTTTATVAITDNDAPQVLFRWAAGGNTIAANDGGLAWSGSTSVVTGGPTQVYAGGITQRHASLPSTAPTALFANERWDPETGAEMGLDFGSGLAAGTYTVRLFMGNGYAGTSTVGSRVFDVLIEDQLVFDNVDLVARFGNKRGGMLEWTGQVTDGRIDIDFAHVVENPLVNAVEILAMPDTLV